TTVVEIGGGGNPARAVGIIDELGIRAYTGPMPLNRVMFSLEDGRLDADWSEERGTQGLRAAPDFAERYDGAAGGRVRARLAPAHTDSCSEELLREFAHQAEQHHLPVTVHAAINPSEVDYTVDRYRLTPIQLLAKVGLLGTHVILGHGIFISGHSWLRYHEAP